MATIKSYTNLEQSKKLAEILPIESADMYWQSNLDNTDREYLLELGTEEYFEIEVNTDNYDIGEFNIPAWSLAILMDILERGALFKTPQGWVCQAYIGPKTIISNYHSNPVDACYEMIIKLNELKML